LSYEPPTTRHATKFEQDLQKYTLETPLVIGPNIYTAADLAVTFDIYRCNNSYVYAGGALNSAGWEWNDFSKCYVCEAPVANGYYFVFPHDDAVLHSYNSHVIDQMRYALRIEVNDGDYAEPGTTHSDSICFYRTIGSIHDATKGIGQQVWIGRFLGDDPYPFSAYIYQAMTPITAGVAPGGIDISTDGYKFVDEAVFGKLGSMTIDVYCFTNWDMLIIVDCYDGAVNKKTSFLFPGINIEYVYESASAPTQKFIVNDPGSYNFCQGISIYTGTANYVYLTGTETIHALGDEFLSMKFQASKYSGTRPFI
jgi:hypothetical protein